MDGGPVEGVVGADEHVGPAGRIGGGERGGREEIIAGHPAKPECANVGRTRIGEGDLVIESGIGLGAGGGDQRNLSGGGLNRSSMGHERRNAGAGGA